MSQWHSVHQKSHTLALIGTPASAVRGLRLTAFHGKTSSVVNLGSTVMMSNVARFRN